MNKVLDDIYDMSWDLSKTHWEYEWLPEQHDNDRLPKYTPLPARPPPVHFLYTLHPIRRHSTSSSRCSTLVEKVPKHLPPKMGNSVLRHLRHTIFSVYRRLFTIVFVANLAGFVYVMADYRGGTGLLLNTFANAITANLTAAILMRQELVINTLFILCGACPQWMPLRVRRLVAKIYHLGGVHSGCGVSAVVWLSLFTGITIRNYIKKEPEQLRHQPTILCLTLIIWALLLGIVIFAHPRIRACAHNSFEAVHRFAGWTAVALFWAEIMALTDLDRKIQVPRPHFHHLLLQNPSFWMLCLITTCLILPWTRLRKVDVESEYLSSRAVRLHFKYTNTPSCCAPRISDNPLKEWHSFACIPEPDGKGFSLIVSNAGDWTRRIILHPPTKLWVRGFLTKGVLAIAPIFKRIVLVATGSGIGPVMSLLVSTNVSCRILWSTPTPETTYNQAILDQVYKSDNRAVIIDTTKSGRPDLVQTAYELYVESNAEAIFVISNPRVSRKVVYGLESRGIPIFAPIFDS